ncbi:hypothetical protein [Nostoc commune]|uniref:hypothetical protein n=1 Tax=Nostoc commune TaxID=1178 RepID=UPI0018C4DC08|nr:hypothetical protein [Nostoc commune]MBG1257779.1 hypothetical protein [Nostoc commune BAE]
MKFYYSPTPVLIGVLIVFVQPQNALAFSSTGSVKVAEAISPACSAKIPTVLSTLEKIRKQAENAEAEIDKKVLELQARLTNDKKARDELENLKNQLKKQLLEVINDEQKYQQALENPNLPQSQKDLLRKIKAKPEEIDKYIEQQTNTKYIAEQQKLRIRNIRKESETKLLEGFVQNCK